MTKYYVVYSYGPDGWAPEAIFLHEYAARDYMRRFGALQYILRSRLLDLSTIQKVDVDSE